VAVRAIQGDAKPGARFIGDGMKRQQSLTQLPLLPGSYLLYRHVCSLPEDTPFRQHQAWNRAAPTIDPRAPLPTRFRNLPSPVPVAGRRPARRGQGEAKGLSPREDYVGKR
jgi:hypothetical protein